MKELLHIFPALLALCLCVSCKDTKAKSKRIVPVGILADGDLVFRHKVAGSTTNILTVTSSFLSLPVSRSLKAQLFLILP